MNGLFTTILNMSIAGAVVIAVILLGRLLLKNAPKKWSYLLWIAAAFRLCCPVSIRSAVSLFRVIPQTAAVKAAAGTGNTASRLSYIPAAVSAPAPTAVPALPSAMPIAQTTGLPSAATAAPAITSAPVSAAPVTAAPITANPIAGAITNEAANTAAPVSPLQIVMTVLTVLWLAGIAALVIYAIVDYLRLRKNVAAATKLAGEKNVFQSENITSPFIIGIFRPRIMVPYGLTEKELQYVLAHERYHLRRGDQIIKLFSFLLLCLHWFNPLCWLAFILMNRDMEMSCDEKVLGSIGSKAGYSSALLSFAAGKRYIVPNPLSFSETNIKGRVKNAMKYKKPKLIVTITAIVLCIAVVAACVVNPKDEGPKDAADATGEPAAEATPTPEPETTPDPASEASPEPTASPVPRMVGMTFKNELGIAVDSIRICYAGNLLTSLTASEGGTPCFDYEDGNADGIIDVADPISREPFTFSYDVAAFADDQIYVLHDVVLVADDTVTLKPDRGNIVFEVVSDGETVTYPAEIYGNDPFEMGERDENLVHFVEKTWFGIVFEDSSGQEGYRVEWTETPEDYQGRTDYLNQFNRNRCTLVELDAEDEARFPELAAAIRENNRSILEEAAKMIPLDRLIEQRDGTAATGPAMNSVSAVAYVRRADTRIVSILYDVWVGWESVYYSYHNVDNGRKYFAATFDTQEGRLLGPNECADGIDGSIKYEPHDPCIWTYDNEGIMFYDYHPETGEPHAVEFHPAQSGWFTDKYLPFTETYVNSFPITEERGLICLTPDNTGVNITSVDISQEYIKETENSGRYDFTIDINGGGSLDPWYINYSRTDHFEAFLDRVAYVRCNGKEYFFVTVQLDNYTTVEVYAFSSGRLFLLSNSSATNRIDSAFTDPGDFPGCGGCTVVGSHYGTFRCGVNGWGRPLRLEWISFREEHEVLLETEAKLVGRDGAETGETVTLQPGWKVIFFRTDGRSMVDMILPDGRIARIETEPYELIGGRAAYEVFADLNYTA